MLNIERYNIISELLQEKKNIKLNEIVEELGISEATARRDLNFLEKQGKIKRIHGGAVLIEEKEENIDYKKLIYPDAKDWIGKKAAEYVENGDTIFLDAGSTTECVIKYLKDKVDIKVVTNGFTHIPELVKMGIETYLLGGKIKMKTGAVVGSTAMFTLDNYNFDVAFMGSNAVGENGYSTPDPDEVLVKREAVKRGKKVFFLCDSSKMNKKSFLKFASLNDGVLITEGDIPENIKKLLKTEGEK